MTDDAMYLYRCFLAGKPGTCAFTGKDGCHAFVTEDDIEATYGSRHDGDHFAWLDQLPGAGGRNGVGFISDDHIDALLSQGHIAFTFSDMSGPAGTNDAGVKAAFMLGAHRMRQALGLPVDNGKRVSAEAIDTLPLALRVQADRLPSPPPVPLALLVEKLIPLATTIEDAEARGRLVALARAAIGEDLAGIEDEAKRWAAWIIDRDGRKAQADKITRQLFGTGKRTLL